MPRDEPQSLPEHDASLDAYCKEACMLPICQRGPLYVTRSAGALLTAVLFQRRFGALF